jgi:hypothetical protein
MVANKTVAVDYPYSSSTDSGFPYFKWSACAAEKMRSNSTRSLNPLTGLFPSCAKARPLSRIYLNSPFTELSSFYSSGESTFSYFTKARQKGHFANLGNNS